MQPSQNSLKDWIIEKILINGKIVSKRCKPEWFIKSQYSKQYTEILDRTSFLKNPTLSQRIWHIYHNKYSPYVCNNPTCTNNTTFFTFPYGYLRTCSPLCAQHDPQTISKIKQTNRIKYGVDYALSNKDVITKRKNTCIKTYGVDNISKLDYISNKKKTTCLKNHGVEWYLAKQKEKEASVFNKYGVNNVLQVAEFQNKVSTTKKLDFYDYITTSDKFSTIEPLFSRSEYRGVCIDHQFKCKLCGTIFIGKIEDGKIPRCTSCFPKHGNSVFQKEIYAFIKELIPSEHIVENNKSVLKGLELDIYIPSKGIAIECDGLFWHGEINGNKNKNYHFNKTILCEEKNIKLIHIFEDEWLYKTTLVKNKLAYMFGCSKEKVQARKCIVREIFDKAIKKQFLTENHIQGNDTSSIIYGLYTDTDKLVAIMTFGNQRVFINNDTQEDNVFELIRYATCKNVVGGAGKLLNEFIKKYTPTKIISYADRRWSTGNLYKKLGFTKTSDGTPNYWYFGKGANYKRYHRFTFAKHTLHKKLKIFDSNLSEWQNMQNNGYDRIWDCGSLKFELVVI